MIELLLTTFASSTFIGFLTSTIPTILTFFENRQRYKYDIELTRLKLEIAEKGHDVAKLTEAKWVVYEGDSLRRHDSTLSTNHNINLFRAAIRPSLTLLFFLLFVIIKVSALMILIKEGMGGIELINNLWDSYTQSIFGAIIGFWFGSRAMIYMNEQFTQPIGRE